MGRKFQEYFGSRKSGMSRACGFFLLAALLSAGGRLSPAAIAGEPDAEAHYQEALQLRSQGQLAEAEQSLLNAIQEEPNNADYHYELANLYVSLYDSWQGSARSPRALMILGRAEREFVQTLTFRPDHLPARFNLGVVYKSEGKYELAREEFRRVLQRSPQQSAAWYQIASTYQEQGFWDEAYDAYMKAREMGYDPSQIQDALEDLQAAQASQQRRASSPMGNMGGAFGNRSGFANDAFSNQGTDPYGRNNGPFYGNGSNSAYGNNGYASGSGGGKTSMSSMAAVLLQQVLAQRSQNSNSQQ